MKKELLLRKKELKAIIYVDERNNYKVTYKDFDLFDSRDNIVRVYKTNKKQNKFIEEKLLESMNVVNDKVESEFKIHEIYELIDELTDLGLKLDLSKEEDMSFWREAVNNPSDLLILIQKEIDEMASFIMKLLTKNIYNFMDLDKDMQDSIIAMNENQRLEGEISKEEEDMIKKQKKIEEFNKQLEEIEKKKAELMK